MICNAKPYEGQDAFLFVSYARKDAGIVYPFIERLASAGVRLWYDAGIHSGENWPEVIADHLNRSAACLIFMSPNATESHNCYNELIFAVESRKPIIPIRYNEAKLTMGMKMVIGAVQWLEITDIPTESDITSILALDKIKPMHGIPDRSIRIQDYQTSQGTLPEEPAKQWIPVSYSDPIPQPQPEPQTTIPQDPVPHADAQQKQIPNAEPQPEPQPESQPEHVYKHVRRSKPTEQELPVSEEKTVGTDILEMTVSDEELNDKTVAENEADLFGEGTIAAVMELPPVIVVLAGEGQRHRGKMGANILGRTKSKSDIVIPDQERKISGAHVCITCSFEGTHIVEDLHSTNGTWLDGEPLTAGERYSVDDFCELLLYKTRVLIAFNKIAETLWQAKALLMLRCEETEEVKYLWHGMLMLGRNHPWKENVLAGRGVSHEHTSFRITGGKCILKDENSTNGTFINGERMEKGSERIVETGDIVQIGNYHFIVTLFSFGGGAGE